MIELVEKFQPIVDKIYKYESRTKILDTATEPDFTNTPTVKYLHVSTTGLGEYSRSNGYPKGDVTAEWKHFNMTQERGKEISVDRMDNEETLNLTFGTVIGNFMREQVIPEMDSYRFAKYAKTANVGTTSDEPDNTNIIEAIDEAVRYMDEREVTVEGRLLFINSNLKVVLNQALARRWGSDNTVNTVLDGYNDMRIIYVPPTRFNTDIQVNTGSTSWGYKQVGNPINFMIVQPNAVVQVQKFLKAKVFNPDMNQDKDAWKYQFRLYHDAFIYENKTSGIYVHDTGVPVTP